MESFRLPASEIHGEIQCALHVHDDYIAELAHTDCVLPRRSMCMHAVDPYIYVYMHTHAWKDLHTCQVHREKEFNK